MTEKLRHYLTAEKTLRLLHKDTIFDDVSIDEIDNIKFCVEFDTECVRFNDKCFYFNTFKEAKVCFSDYCTDDKECDTFIVDRAKIYLEMILFDNNDDCIKTIYLDAFTQFSTR